MQIIDMEAMEPYQYYVNIILPYQLNINLYNIINKDMYIYPLCIGKIYNPWHLTNIIQITMYWENIKFMALNQYYTDHYVLGKYKTHGT